MTSTTSTTSTPTAEEALESLTGFEEIAIEQAFGHQILDLAEDRPLTYVRALIFALKQRDGLSVGEAKKAALSLTVKQVQDFFPDEDEVMPEEPVTASGKGDSEHE